MNPFTHPQMDPELNRVYRVPGPAEAAPSVQQIEQPEVDPQNPYYPCHTGFFDGAVLDENGIPRKYRLYVPETMQTSGNSILIFMDGGCSAEEWIGRNPWTEILEKHQAAAFFIEAPQGWNLENPGYELDVATKMLAEMRSMNYYPCNAPDVYALGFGDGAAMAAVFAMTHAGVLAAWAGKGPCRLDPEVIRWIGDSPSDGDSGIPKKEEALPSWILDGEEESPVAEYFRRACHTQEEGLRNAFAHVYREKPKPGELYLNEQAVSEVWHSRREDLEGKSEAEILDKMTGFVTHFRRWGGEGNWHIRLALSPEDMGLIRYEKTIDGLKRHWHMFEPTAYKRGKKEKYPLVIAIHGFSCSGPFFAENSGWQGVAEERGFLLVFPTAYPFHRTVQPPSRARRGGFERDICRTPVWNSNLQQDPCGPDDVSFFSQMLEEIKARYPVDESRIYVTGHSNGSAMTQRLMRCMPEAFAGFAPVGGLEMTFSRSAEPQPNHVVRPVWYFMGERDIGDISLEPGSDNDKTLRNMCQCNGLDYGKALHFENGIYQNTMVCNEEHVPLVRFTGILNWPHTYTPDVALMIWDEFFCRLIREKDGSITYIG